MIAKLFLAKLEKSETWNIRSVTMKDSCEIKTLQ